MEAHDSAGNAGIHRIFPAVVDVPGKDDHAVEDRPLTVAEQFIWHWHEKDVLQTALGPLARP